MIRNMLPLSAMLVGLTILSTTEIALAKRTECVDLSGVGYSAYNSELSGRTILPQSKFCIYSDTMENGTKINYELAYIKYPDGSFEVRVKRENDKYYFLLDSGQAPKQRNWLGRENFVFPKFSAIFPQSPLRFTTSAKVPISNLVISREASTQAQVAAQANKTHQDPYLAQRLQDVPYVITSNGEMDKIGDLPGGKAYDFVSKKFKVIDSNATVQHPVSAAEISTIKQVVSSLTDEPAESVVLMADEGMDYDTIILGLRMKLPSNFKVIVIDASALNSSGGYAGVVDGYISALKTQARSEPTIFILPELKNFVSVGTHREDPVGALEKLAEVIRSGEMRIVGIESAADLDKHVPTRIKTILKKIVMPPIPTETLTLRVQNFIQQLKYNELDQFLINQIVELAAKYDFSLEEPQRSLRLAKQAITEAKAHGRRDILREDIDAATATLYGVNLSFLDPSKVQDRLLKLKNKMDEMVIGLDRQKDALYDTFVNASLGFHDNKGPAVSMMLTGPAGTGKTEFCQAAAQGMGVPIELIAFSQFKDPRDLPKIMGKVISALSKNPYTVICLDEIEKAPREVQDVLLNMLNDSVFTGEIEDSKGDKRSVKSSARFATVIATSNLADKTITRWYDEEKHLRPIVGSSWRDGETLLAMKSAKVQLAYGGEGKFSEPLLDRFKILLPVYPLEKETFKILVNKAVKVQIDIAKNACRCEIKVTNLEEWTKDILTPLFESRNSNRDVSKFVSEFLAKEVSRATKANNTYTVTLKNPFLTPAETAPWDDPRWQEMMKDLDKKIKSEIFGQDEIIDDMVTAFKSHTAQGSARKRPLSFYFMGTTGTGKTELAKVFTRMAFGAGVKENRLVIIPMGEVTDDNKWADIFDYARGGSCSEDDTKKFEKALRQTMSGGTIAFDEFSNVGGSDRGMRNRYAKFIYNMLDEGKWTSPCTGITYDLSNRVFIFTGNDGEENFRGLSAEDLRLSVWRKIKQMSVMRELMLENGLPEAFIERIAASFYFKPLVTEDAIKISDKFIKSAFKPFSSHIKLIYDDQFSFNLVRATFSSRNGGRGVRRLIDNAFLGMVADSLVDFKARHKEGEGQGEQIRLSINDNIFNTPYMPSPDFKRKVEFVIEVSRGAVKEIYRRDITHYSVAATPVSRQMARLIAYHEMGHAVVNNPKITGQILDFITIVGADGYLGYARYENGPVMNPNRNSLIMTLAKMYGGSIAQQLAGYPKDSGWANDLEQMRQTVFNYVVTYGLNGRFLGLTLNKENKPVLKSRDLTEYRTFANEILKASKEVAILMLEKNWDIVRDGVEVLMKDGKIDANGFLSLVSTTVQKRQTSQFTYVINEQFKKTGLNEDDFSASNNELKRCIEESYRMEKAGEAKPKLTPRIIQKQKVKEPNKCETSFAS